MSSFWFNRFALLTFINDLVRPRLCVSYGLWCKLNFRTDSRIWKWNVKKQLHVFTFVMQSNAKNNALVINWRAVCQDQDGIRMLSYDTFAINANANSYERSIEIDVSLPDVIALKCDMTARKAKELKRIVSIKRLTLHWAGMKNKTRNAYSPNATKNLNYSLKNFKLTESPSHSCAN